MTIGNDEKYTMKKTTMLLLVGLCTAAMACSSSGEQPSSTHVEGMVVVDQADLDREFTDEEVAQFAEAYTRVTAIQQQYDAKMLEDEYADHGALIEERDALVDEAIHDSGLTHEEYNLIAVILPDDDELRQRVREAIRDRDERRVRETERTLETE